MRYRTLVLSLLLVVLLVFSTRSFSMAMAVGRNWMSSALPLVPLSIAAGIIISCGQIDIASGAILTFGGMVVVGLVHVFGATTSSVLVSVIVEIACLTTIYGLMWAVITFGRVSALLCTLGFSFCGQSLSLLIQAFVNSQGGRHHLSFTPVHVVGSMTVPVSGFVSVFSWRLMWIALVVLVLTAWRYRSDAGLQHIAVGMNRTAAELANVKIKRINLTAFLVSGLLVGLSTAMYLVFQEGGWAPNTGVGKELFAIAAAVVGGTRIQGGRFDPLCVAVATVVMSAVREVINALHLPVDMELLVLGIGLILVAVLDFSTASWKRSIRVQEAKASVVGL